MTTDPRRRTSLLVTPDPNRVGAALQDWLAKEIAEQSGKYFELGKFLFTISTGSFALFPVALKSLGLEGQSNAWLFASLAFSLACIGLSVFFVWPQKLTATGTLDLVVSYNRVVRRRRQVLGVWVACLAVALVAGALSLFPAGARGAASDGPTTVAPG